MVEAAAYVQWELRDTLNFTAKAEKPSKMKRKKKAAKGAARNSTKESAPGGKGRRKHKTDKMSRAQPVIHQVDDWRMKLPDKNDDVETLPFRFLAKREKYDIHVHLGRLLLGTSIWRKV